ncbi:MAG: T9SS type A sorting domain-containing protein, partial [Bacteroidetes bacterium]|nr:T9SS type A sorting domain-containing protein [Bacteroidota bacterium]
QDISMCVNNNEINLNVEVLQQNSILKYQWYKNDTALVDDARIKGSNTSNLFISPAQLTDKGKYWVNITDITTGAEIQSNKVDVALKGLSLEYVSDSVLYIRLGLPFTLYKVRFKASEGEYKMEEVFRDSVISTNTQKVSKFGGYVGIIANSYISLLAQAGLYEFRWYSECDTIIHRVRVILVDDEGNPIETIVSSVEDNQNDIVLNINPNPVTNRININFNFNSEELNTIIELLDISGSRIATIFDGMAQSGLNEINYDLSRLNLSNGTYFIKITQGIASQVRPFIFVK